MPLLTLCAQSVAMFVASFGIGYLPLAFNSVMGGKLLKATSVFGMGLLVGAALTVIIPEGVDTLYDSLPPNKEGVADTGTTIGVALLSGFALMLLVESLTPHPQHHHLGYEEPDDLSAHHHDPEHGPEHPEEENNGHATAAHTNEESVTYFNGPYNGNAGSLRMDSSTRLFPLNGKPRQSVRTSSTKSVVSNRCQESEGGASGTGVAGLNATLGLVIHAMADGIALGSSSLSGNGGLGFVVFLAVIVHKGPTALGLTTTLLSLKLSPAQIRRRLLLFSLSAPVGAILTYLIVYMFGGGRHDPNPNEVNKLGWWTGATLLFSGGSFLYVATVVQPLSDLDSHITHEHAHTHDDEEQLSKWTRLTLLGGGMLLPLAMSLVFGGHEH